MDTYTNVHLATPLQCAISLSHSTCALGKMLFPLVTYSVRVYLSMIPSCQTLLLHTTVLQAPQEQGPVSPGPLHLRWCPSRRCRGRDKHARCGGGRSAAGSQHGHRPGCVCSRRHQQEQGQDSVAGGGHLLQLL